MSLKENPFVQQAGPLASSEVKALAEQGYSVALSADGDTAIVGGPAYKETNPGEVFRGAAWIYVRSGSTWTQQAKLVGHESSGDAQQGHSVAISANGDTAIVGGPEDTGEHEEYFGAAWVFVREGTTWHEQQKLVAKTGASEKGAQGSSVALSADGDTALVGAMDNEYNKTTTRAPGAAFVFTRSGSTWSQQGGKLDGKHSGELVQEGTSVALSSDGKTALIGGPRSEGEKGEREAGAAWVFTWNGSEWKEQAKLPQGSGTGLETGQGQSVALSGDGDTALVGGPGYASFIGGAWVYARSGEKWEQQGPPLQGNDAGTMEADLEGSGVALSEDGDAAVVGGYADDIYRGAAWAFQRSGSSWSEQEKLEGTGGEASAEQGYSVALSADGGTALIGAAGETGEEGATWVFARAPESSGEESEPEANKETKEELNPNPNNPSTGGQGNPNGTTSSVGGTSTGGPSSGSGNAGSQGPKESEAEKLATELGLPSSKACYSKRTFKIHIQQPHGYPKVVSAEVFLGAKRERSLNKHGLADQVVLTGLPYGTFTIKIVAKTVKGTTLTGTRTYHTCRAKPIRTHRHPRL
jgi:FG-GAP repeat